MRTGRNIDSVHPTVKLLSTHSAFPLALSLSLLAAFLAGDWSNWAWHLGTLGSAWAILGLCAWPSVRRVVRWMIPTFALGLALTTTLVGFGVARWGSVLAGARVQLFYDNPNLLGAALATSAVSSLVLIPKRLSVPVWILSVLGIALTGSRLSLAGAVLGLLTWMLVSKAARYTIPVLFALLILFAVPTFLVQRMQSDGGEVNNLLKLSQDFERPEWRKSFAVTIDVVSNAVPGPVPGSHADRIVAASSSDHTLVIYQSAGQAKLGVPYVASIYLRSEEPQRVRLSTQLSRAICEIDSRWRRCVTPVGYGDDYSDLQLRLETLNYLDRFDVYAWGAQIERGTNVTAVQSVRSVSPTNVLLRLHRSKWFEDIEAFSARAQASFLAGRIFLDSPLAGVGLNLDQFNKSYKEARDNPYGVNHPHNAPLYVLAAMGILGGSAWLLAIGSSLLGLRSPSWRFLAPSFIAIAVLNTADLSFFSSGVFYVFWSVIGIARFVNQE